VKGLYILTEEDAMQGARFDDAVAWRSGYLDIGWVRMSQMKIHQVPYRAIIPEKVDGLLTAGRCMSATHEGASAGKSMGNCMAIGHAAGIAGALAVLRNKQPRQLAVTEIQEALRNDGVDLSRGGEIQDEKMID
jgi:succinate dehydrogenase/fumarate reductase flavoprotein subunit